MTATVQIHPGMTVIGSDGAYLGEIEEVLQQPRSGRVTGVVIKSGRWLWTERKELSIDLVDAVDMDAGTVEVFIGKRVFQAVRNRH